VSNILLNFTDYSLYYYHSLLGEITPAIAVAVGKSKAEKILIPSNKCKIIVAGMHDLTLGEAINQAVQTVLNYKNEK